MKTPHISLKIKGKLSVFMQEALKKEYGKKLILKDEHEDDAVDFFQTSLAKKIEKEAKPGNCLKIYRENLSLTQEELGDKIGVSKNYVSDMENGRRTISKEKAKLFGKMFNISAEHF
ncbi:helix-turn-helix transcriptional regulator, partial [Fibrobacterota bacterium]